MRLAAIALAALLAALLVDRPLAAEDPPAVRVSEPGGARIADAALPGVLLDVAFPRSGAGHEVVLLVASAEPDAPRALYRLVTEGEARLEPLAASLPEDARALQVIPQRNGAELHLLGLGTKTLRFVPGMLAAGKPRLLETPLPALGLLVEGGESALAFAEVGRLRLFDARGDGTLREAGSQELPVAAERERAGLKLTSPRVTQLARPDGSPLFLVGPEAQGNRRLRVLVLDPEAEDPETQGWEAWCLLPFRESVDRAWFLWMDAEPVLLVTTYSAEKVGIFEKQKLRLFKLRADRTRSGRKPTLATLTASRRWQQTDPTLSDLDGDGFADLLVIQPEGLGGGKLIAEAFLGNGSGAFRVTPRQTVVKAPGERWVSGQDVDGDGFADLVALSEGHLEIYSGNAHSTKRGVVEKKPRWSIPLPSREGPEEVKVTVGPDGTGTDFERPPSRALAGGRLRLVDLDGDGRVEVLRLADRRAVVVKLPN